MHIKCDKLVLEKSIGIFINMGNILRRYGVVERSRTIPSHDGSRLPFCQLSRCWTVQAKEEQDRNFIGWIRNMRRECDGGIAGSPMENVSRYIHSSKTFTEWRADDQGGCVHW